MVDINLAQIIHHNSGSHANWIGFEVIFVQTVIGGNTVTRGTNSSASESSSCSLSSFCSLSSIRLIVVE